jgi:hypothetical protein
MKQPRRHLAVLAVAGWAIASLAPGLTAQTPPLTLAFEPQAATIAGATPGGDVVLWCVYRERLARVSTHVGKLGDRVSADAGGGARLDLGRDVPGLSVWAAVDLASGQVALASPGGFQWTEIDPKGRRIDKALGRLAVDRHELSVLLVRPGLAPDSSGSWQLDVFDGGALDEDGAYDGSLRASLAAFLPDRKAGHAPPRFEAGDVVVAVDPADLAAFSLTVGN